MIRRYALWGKSAVFSAMLLLAVLSGVGSQVANAQNKPELPTLSLTGSRGAWNTNYYPDGRIWVPRRGANGERILLVPVFIKNCWRSTSTYEAFPIYSFKTKFQYDSSALEFIGVEKNGLNRGPQGSPLGCLAKDFEFTSEVARDTTYQRVINGPLDNRLRGRRVLITGISSKPLPQTGDFTSPCDQRPFVEFFYMKFRVIANPASNPVSARTPIILTNDTLFYNDFQVGVELPFPDDQVPTRFAGLDGADNYYIDQFGVEQIRDPLRPSRPGMIWVEATDEIPRLSFTNVADRRFRLVDSIDNTNNAEWFVVEPITLDSGSQFVDEPNGVGTRDIDVINATSGSRAYDIRVQSDKKWLYFHSFRKGGQGEIDPFGTRVREGFIPMLDKGILGTTLGNTPQAEATTLQRDLNLRIICDPNGLEFDGVQGEFAGKYIGHLTFESPFLDVSPVRLKVTFIYFRLIFEPHDFTDGWEQGFPACQEGGGMNIEIRNSNSPVERTNLVFGTGARARDQVDTLFGEGLYTSQLASFGARWYPRDKNNNDIYEFGLSDQFAYTFSSLTAGCGQSYGPKSSSRDVRDIYSDTTLMYYCRFNAGSALNYPVVVSWDTDYFPEGSELFIRDILNGSRFNVNMYEATNIGGTRRSFTIRDADIDAFVIEYTLPKVAQFPVINRGWNLLSLPVNPSSSYWQDVFKNALNIPIRFAQNSFQTNEINLQPGIGYFVKYSTLIDRTIAGARIRRIDDVTFPTRIYEGWNTVGSLSTPTSVENIGPLLPQPGETRFPTRVGDVYRYVTDRGYQAVSEITPGLGYWMKVSANAFYVLTGAAKGGVDFANLRNEVTGASTPVHIEDRLGRNTDLYLAQEGVVARRDVFELPPLPPHDLFDVRFSNESYVEDATNPMIKFQGASFPVTLTVNNPAQSYNVVNPVSGEIVGTIHAGANNSVIITDGRVPAVRLMATETETLSFNAAVTPNPVAAQGVVNVTMPKAGTLTVELYSSIGELVSTLHNGNVTTGIHSFDLNGSALVPGRYILKVTNNGTTLTNSVTIVR